MPRIEVKPELFFPDKVKKLGCPVGVKGRGCRTAKVKCLDILSRLRPLGGKLIKEKVIFGAVSFPVAEEIRLVPNLVINPGKV